LDDVFERRVCGEPRGQFSQYVFHLCLLEYLEQRYRFCLLHRWEERHTFLWLLSGELEQRPERHLVPKRFAAGTLQLVLEAHKEGYLLAEDGEPSSPFGQRATRIEIVLRERVRRWGICLHRTPLSLFPKKG
jgi:hypothetical protein